MFRVGRKRKIVVVAPQAWFPGQALIRIFRKHFRPIARRFEVMSGVDVYRPRYLSFPGIFKGADGFLMAVSCFILARRLVREQGLNVLDAHFAYPDGYAGALLSKWLRLPMVLTLRGKEARQAVTGLRPRLERAVRSAAHLITVSDALRTVALGLGASSDAVRVIGNGIDTEKFSPIDRREARRQLGLPETGRMLLTVGTLIDRKGFHRVIETLPSLLKEEPDLYYLVVGGAGPEGDRSAQLKALTATLQLQQHVHFLGSMAPERLHIPLSAADVFVLASSYEGWANVLLEAMACGLPVVATDVGGNAQVVRQAQLGTIVPFGDKSALTSAIGSALRTTWNSASIRAYAIENAWDQRIPLLVGLLDQAADSATMLRAHSRKIGVSAGWK